MPDPKPRIDILIVDDDPVSSATIAAAFKNNTAATSVFVANNVSEAKQKLDAGITNALVIDIFSLGVDIGIDLIKLVRKEHPAFPICLIGTTSNLHSFPNVPRSWKARFSHYYKMAKDLQPDQLRKSAEVMAYKLFTYWLARSAKVKLSDLRDLLLKMEAKSTTFSVGTTQEIYSTIDFAQKAIEAQSTQKDRLTDIVPGFQGQDIQALVNKTLENASRALDKSTTVNTGILIFGALLIAASFVVASMTGNWESVAFGGFGLAGVIASLITNPLKSIGITSRRVVQIQVAYLGFLNQISMINEAPNDTTDAVIKKSERLQDVMQSIQETLKKHYG